MPDIEIELEFKFPFTQSENIIRLLYEGHHGEDKDQWDMNSTIKEIAVLLYQEKIWESFIRYYNKGTHTHYVIMELHW